MEFRVSSRVDREFAEVVTQYLERSIEAADRFVGEFEHALSAIRSDPSRYASYLPELYGAAYRHYLMDRFPYSVIYEASDTEVIILAVAHASREVGYWRKEE